MAAVEAAITDPGGFHEAECAVDGDPDTEWLGQAAQPGRLVVTLQDATPLAALAFKTGPRAAGLTFRMLGVEGREVGRLRIPPGGEWGLERFGLPPGQPVKSLEALWPASREAPRLFHLELRARGGR